VDLFIPILCLAASLAAAPRWLRIAQREHYHPRSVTRFAIRWWSAGQVNLLLAVAAVTASLSAFSLSVMALVTAGIIVAAPAGLTLRGRTSALAWTRRLRTVAAVFAVLDVALFLLAAATPTSAALASILCFLQPVIVDIALLVTLPFERTAAKRWVRQAEQRLRAAAPVTVAITGSFGKTTTKLYVRHLVAGQRSVLASPASFNNTGGLARTLNEHLAPDTEVFVAEMGTYGPGEIRAMCAWVRPTIGVIVNIGPVHLERMKSLDGVVKAKAEITEGVQTAVLNVSAHGLAALADQLAARGTRVVRVATEPDAAGADVIALDDGDGNLDVCAAAHRHRIEGTAAHAANVASALGVVVALGLDVSAALARLDSLPVAEHRQEVSRSAKGVVVIDNTFSSNPASAASSLALVRRLAERGARSVVVTPGMVELGPLQMAENREFAVAADDAATDLVVVGQTNRKALVAGAAHRDIRVHFTPTRDKAVEWVRATLTDGDVVLYENDLPDHYP
jgi:UDP-N-acetylmuramoyl-tripeptide--D-alanyl-D-alanine ligase